MLSLYVAGSGFLLVESFRQVFKIPPDTFELPSWVGLMPHFGQSFVAPVYVRYLLFSKSRLVIMCISRRAHLWQYKFMDERL